MKECPSDTELSAFVEHALSSVVRKRVETHLHGCEACRETIGHVASTQDADPRVIDRYRLDAKVGEGGMGVVWKAWDPALEREIAIKLLHPELHDTSGRQRALREAKALARLQHPNVIAVYDVGEFESEVFIATEFVDGCGMDTWQRGKSAEQIIAAYAQAARGLAAAHALGLVHRDVKPSNLLVANDGRVRVGDFGLATNAAPNSLKRPPPQRALPTLTERGEQIGTPAYMAPEQRTTTRVDARADQYSLCLALTEALLGNVPPEAPSAQLLARSGVIAPWDAIARGLSVDPSDRFDDIGELAARLEHAPPRRSYKTPVVVACVALGSVLAVALIQQLSS